MFLWQIDLEASKNWKIDFAFPRADDSGEEEVSVEKVFLFFTVETNRALMKMEEKIAFVPYTECTEPLEKSMKCLGVFA